MSLARGASTLSTPSFVRRAFTNRRLSVTTASASTGATLAAPAKSSPYTFKVPPMTVAPATHPAFELMRDEMVDEYGVRTTLYKHTKSGAEVLSVMAADENKVFGITFRTPPSDSTGVPHILEHSVLCGSRKFKSKEPFVELLKGSLQTFLNAFTYPDRTCYPVASCNLKDFYNLVHVYLDAVLHPRAMVDPMVLKQEGWHYEIESPTDPLTLKGVVYNEMKGVYSSPDSLLAKVAQEELFPSNTYGVDSGGDPLNIPDLTFDGFKAFHGEFYHPSNSRVFFYGDDSVPARLELLDSYLAEFDAIEPRSAVAIQPVEDMAATKTKGNRIVGRFPASDLQDQQQQAQGQEAAATGQHMVQVNWLLNEQPFTGKEQLAISLLDHLLMGTSAATLRKALTDSGLGNEVIGGGLSDELSQATFSAGLKGVKPEDVEKVEALVESVLSDFAASGPEASAVEASMNTVEFSLREFNTGSFPKGLSFMLGAMSQWIYDRDPLDGLRFEEPLRELKADLASGVPVFEDLARKLLLNNAHKVTVEMVPDSGLEKAQVEEETSRLAAIKAGMSPEDIDTVISETKKLKEAQARHDSPEELATIPSLGLEDLDPNQLELPNEVSVEHGATVLRHEVPSNGILYADVGFDLTTLDASELPLVKLFSRCLTSTGLKKSDAGEEAVNEVALSRRIGSTTGGVGVSTFTGCVVPADGSVASGDELVHKLFVRGKVVGSKPEALFGVALALVTRADFGNKKRILEMLKESKSGMEASIVSAGHAYASTRLSAPHTTAGALGEVTGGVAYLAVLKDLLAQAENDFPALQLRLENMRDALLTSPRDSLVVNLSGDAATLAACQPAVDHFLQALPAALSVDAAGGVSSSSSSSSKLGSWKTELSTKFEAKNEGFVVPTQVNYVGKGGRLYAPGEMITGSASVVARALRTGYLWDTVRVMGGAYGGFCRFSALTGTFSYLSYRDPNLLGTLDYYDGSSAFLQGQTEAVLTDEALAQAIIGAVGDLDGPLGPDAKGFEAMRRWLVQESPEMRKQWRSEILATTKQDFVAFGDKLASLQGNSVVFSSKQALEDANTALGEKQASGFELVELL